MNRIENITKIYLDSNILINVADGRNDHLKSLILASAHKGKRIFPFSATQISEITSNSLSERCNSRLNFLSEISKNIYFVHSTYDYGFRIESPSSVWRTINEVAIVPNENKLFASFIPFDQLRALREQLGLDPNLLNNLDGREAVAVIDKALSAAAPAGIDAPRSIKELLGVVKKIVREQFSPLWASLGTTEKHMTIGNDIGGVFSLLESFGYWPDSEKTYKKGSRFSDGQHVFNASHFDILVTHDKGMKNRSEAVYTVLGINTRVMHSNEFATYINQN